jgi:ADP-ribose pyrophosphatase
MHLFIATNLTKIDKRRKMDDDEDIVVRRLKLSSAVRKCLDGGIEDAKTIAAIMAYASCYSPSSLKPF